MTVRDEIDTYAAEADKPVPHWLFSRYHLEYQWRFVARCKFDRYGVESYAVNRVWSPTDDGRVLHAAQKLREALMECEPLVGEYPVAKRMAREALDLAHGKIPEVEVPDELV